MKADTCNPADVIVERTLALTLQGYLLMKGLVNSLKAGDSLIGFLYNGGLTPFFS
jgi:hypothetical protein